MKKEIGLFLLFVTSGFSQTLKINELMYAPKNGGPEWLELYNCSSDSVNIRNWNIRNKNARFYVLTDTDFYVQADSYLVLTKSDTIFSFHHLIPSRVLICPALPTSFMVNAGDTMSIYDSTGVLVDSVFYDPSWGGSDGKSLERISVDVSPFASTNWGGSIDSSGSTPGRRNSIAAWNYDLKITDFSASVSSSDLEAIFRIMVKNCGSHPTSPFDLDVFLDYDNDLVPRPDELAAESHNIAGLIPRDSIQIVLKATPKNLQALNAMAKIQYLSDQDTANNFMWIKLEFSYAEKCLVVNEIMYAPKTPEPEWVELFNTSSDSVDLEDFTLSDNSGTKAVITNGPYLFPPNDYVVVAHDSGFLGIHPDVHGKILITKIPSLNNTGDIVAIHDASGNLIDSVNYSPSWGGNTGGKSLERILPSGGSNDPQNFETSTDSSGCTPAKINSVTPRDCDLAVGTIRYFPNPVQSGKNVTISVSIINRGLKSSGMATIIFFADKNGNGTCDSGEPVDSTQILQITSGDSTTVTFISAKLSVGLYRFGICVDYPSDELQVNNTKTFCVNVGFQPSSIIINEVMYAPKAPEKEWLELYNTTDSVVDLSNFKIETHGGLKKIKAGSIVAPEDFVVLCDDSSVSQFHYPVKDLVTQSIPPLSNGGDWIVLSDSLGNLVDSIAYVPSYGGSSGKSLERIDCFAGNDSTNWHESIDSTGATPGFVNSVAKLAYDVSLKRLECPKAMDVNQEENVSLVIQNAGRNVLSGIDCSVEISSNIDRRIVFSQNQTLVRDLSPGDTASENLTFTLSQPGTYRICAAISQQQDQRLWNDTLLACINVCYQPQSMVVNEIMYSSTKTGEYFEVYNASPNPIEIADWTFHTSSNQLKPPHLSVVHKIFNASNYFVIAADSSIRQYVPDTALVQIVKSMTLPDEGGPIVLEDPSGVIVDSVCYSPSWHNSDVANTSGRSLEKINPTLSSNDKMSWSTCVSQDGGTPGKRNSIFMEPENATGSLSVAPNPFSPDGDGIDDFTFIDYSFPVSSVKVRIRIFDSIGRLIATPVDNAILPSTGKMIWDGRDGSGKIVRFGLYILFVEVTGPDGKSLSTYKKPLVVAKRMR